MKLTTTMIAVAALCTLASGCVSTQTAADRASTVRLKLNAAQDDAAASPGISMMLAQARNLGLASFRAMTNS